MLCFLHTAQQNRYSPSTSIANTTAAQDIKSDIGCLRSNKMIFHFTFHNINLSLIHLADQNNGKIEINHIQDIPLEQL